MAKAFHQGQRVRLPGESVLVTVEMAAETSQGWQLFVDDGSGTYRKILLTPALAEQVTVVAEDGAAEPAVVLAGLWAQWMRAATLESKATTLATTPLRPYAHQTNAVYGSMLPQPRLRSLLADEPGTGKTIMAGMYLREMQRLGFVPKALAVCPAHLVEKWRADFARFFGGGLKRITADTVREGALAIDHDFWVTSLDLASVNAMVQEAIRPDRVGWDAVVIDEAHRMTLRRGDTASDLEKVVVEQSLSARAEKEDLKAAIRQLDIVLDKPDMAVSKWPRMVEECLAANGIVPGNGMQVVVFTEFADTTEWLVGRFRDGGYWPFLVRVDDMGSRKADVAEFGGQRQCARLPRPACAGSGSRTSSHGSARRAGGRGTP